jgi:hypothetical protein
MGALQGQVEQLAGTAQALQEGTDALQAIRDLPESLQTTLEQAMQHAVHSAQQRQETLTTAYLERIREFLEGVTSAQHEGQQLYADLVLGVQQSVAQLLSGSGGRQDEILAELRTLNGKVAQDGMASALRSLGTTLSAVHQGVAQLTNGSGQGQDKIVTELQSLNAYLQAVLQARDGGSLRRQGRASQAPARALQGREPGPAGQPGPAISSSRLTVIEPVPSDRHASRTPPGVIQVPAPRPTGQPEAAVPDVKPAAPEPVPSRVKAQAGTHVPKDSAEPRRKWWNPFGRS